MECEADAQGVGTHFPIATTLAQSAILRPKLWERVRMMMNDSRQHAPATLRNRDFILGILRDVLRECERVLFRILNANASMGTSLALSGHRFRVIALDGNPVPTQAMVDELKLDVAERADVIVKMNNPGVWVFGSTDDDDREMGMGVVVEYANRPHNHAGRGVLIEAGARFSRGGLFDLRPLRLTEWSFCGFSRSINMNTDLFHVLYLANKSRSWWQMYLF